MSDDDGEWKTVGVSAVTPELANALFGADPSVRQSWFPPRSGRSGEYQFLPIAFLHQEKRISSALSSASGAWITQTLEIRVVPGKATPMATVIPIADKDPTPENWVDRPSDEDELGSWVTKSFVSAPAGLFATTGTSGESAPVVGFLLQEHVVEAATRVKLAEYTSTFGVMPVRSRIDRLDLWQPNEEE